jgi:simple sugar transport system ATP-binding protein/ribose transport system ATP-binding protein
MSEDPAQLELPHLEVRGIHKAFGATQALEDVSLEVRTGTVHAFVGENGAGKSTLGRIIAGVFPQDRGSLVLRGTPVSFSSPRQALQQGIALVAQELALVPGLTVAENVFLGNEPRRRGMIDRRTLLARFTQLCATTGFVLPAEVPVRRLPIGLQQQVEILRAVARDVGLVVLDEPTASLSAAEVASLHALVRRLVASGRTVILVSHFLAEVLELADTVTILRDGRVVRTGPAAAETEDSLIAGMLGRSLGRTFPPKQLPADDAPTVLAVERLVAPGVSDVSLSMRAGEIVALAGLIGAGRSELARAIFGASPATSLRLDVADRPLRGGPRAALDAGLALIPESRKDDGLLLGRPVRENVSIASLGRLSRFGFVRRRHEAGQVATAITKARVSTSLEAPAGTLSGGNQQKLMFARSLLEKGVVLIADEPTRGVDVGAKREIYEHLVALATSGVAILLISSEIEEILGLAHRTVVMRAGRVVAELSGPGMTEEAVLNAAFGRIAA